MDKGAHFYNCDFQVHTPRDLNWTGAKFGVNSDEIELLACQCLIIFDGDFPDNDLDSVVNFLGLNPNNEYEKNHTQICRISEEIITEGGEKAFRLRKEKYGF